MIKLDTIKKEVKANLALSLPLIATSLVFSASSFISTVMVAQLGKNALAASVLVSMIWMSLSVLFFGMLNSVSVLISHQYGQKNYQMISNIMSESYILGGIICILIFISLLSIHFFIDLSGQSAEVTNLSLQYLHAMLWTVPALVVIVLFDQFLAGIGRTKLVMKISIAIVPIEILFIYLLVFGKLGFPALGIAGIGYGLAVSNTIIAGFLILYLLTSKHYQQFGLLGGIHNIQFSYLKELIRIGLPLGFMQLIEVSTFAVATFEIARFGTSILAAHQIALQYLGIAITVVFAMSNAISIRVGHAVGKANLEEVKLAVYVGMLMNFSIIFLVTLIFIFFPKIILRIDFNTHDPKNFELLQHSSILLIICGVLMIFDNFRIIGFGALRALKDAHFSMVSTFFAFWIIGLISATLLAFYFHFDGYGIWAGLTIGIASGALMIVLRLHYLFKNVDLREISKIAH